jgi:leucyl/phenylalanyl-tRNA--protein transferase
MIPWLEATDPFPPVEDALEEPNGLLAAGADLSPERLLEGYRRGIFAWFNDDDPVLWWSPDPRMVLVPGEFRLTRSLRKVIRSGMFRVTLDHAFGAVLAGCAAPRDGQEGTWITSDMAVAYARLARLGHAHSVEVWLEDTLVGGLYGVAVGRMFYGESMFSRASNASKVALAYLSRQLDRWAFPLIDCQLPTPHLESLGARPMARRTFVASVRDAVTRPGVAGPWQFDADVMADL